MTDATDASAPCDNGHDAARRTAAMGNAMGHMWAGGWRRQLFPSLWLIYLGQVVTGVHKHSSGAAAVVGYVIVAAFAATYLSALPLGWRGRYREYWALYAVALALTAVECVFAGHDALVFLVYLAVLTVAPRTTASLVGVVALAATAVFVPPLVPHWHQDADWSTGLTVLLVAFAMYGFFTIIQTNLELASARAEVARLAAENERSRIARDLHDLLGHSLTAITVKAGLARRLAEKGEDERARTEIAEVEQLSRRTLGDVRAAVSAHREMTLTGELATAREVLRASDIIAELPPSVAEVDPDVDELFGWVVREGVTNAVRHSRAAHLTVTVGRRTLVVSDDGRGAQAGRGNGLAGLQERVDAHGGRLTVGEGGPGFSLQVDVPAPVKSSPAPETVDAP